MKERVAKQSRRIDEFPDMSQSSMEDYKKKWQQDLQDIEQRWNDFCWEHEKYRKDHTSCKAYRT